MAKKIWIVAAGTGGHIFPGVAVAREMGTRLPQSDFLFFGTRDRLESRLIPEAGYAICFLSAGQWKGQGLLGRVGALVQLTKGFLQVVGKILREGRPAAFISVGGYVSAPTALACLLFGVPFFIIEPNIRTGMANRLLSRFARKGFSTPSSDAPAVMKCPVLDTGSPVRAGFTVTPVREQVKRILVLGGSQGAKALCEASLALARSLDLPGHGIELVVQSGEKNLEFSVQKMTALGLKSGVQVKAFIDDMRGTLASVDLVLARAGAASVAELAMTGLPTVFVPFPYAADDHQRVNAKILEDAGASRLVDERESDFQAKLERSVRELCFEAGHLVQRQKLAENFRKFARPRAAADIAQAIVREMGGGIEGDIGGGGSPGA